MSRVGRQCVILAGGRGTRLGALVDAEPKPMLTVAGRPFVEHLVREARRFGFDRFLFLAGYRGDRVAEHFAPTGSLARELGAQFATLTEREPLGTAGALRLAKDLLDDWFLMLNGDSYFDFNVLDLASATEACIGRIALRRVADVSRYGVVETDNGRVASFRARSSRSGPGLVNGGVYWLSKSTLDYLPEGSSSLEDHVFPRLAEAGLLQGKPYAGYFIDIGVPADYDAAGRELAAALRRPAVFFDRDNVLNEDKGYTHRVDDFEWVAGAPAAIKACNDAGCFVFVVSNQAGVARGFYDVAAVESLHDWMNEELCGLGAHIDAFRFCPHHPEGTVPAYAVECSCRKPQPGMILDLLKSWPVNPESSILIGDKTSDLEAGLAAGIRSVQFSGGNLERFVRALLPSEVGKPPRVADEAL